MSNWLITENIIGAAALITATTVLIIALIRTSKFIKRVVHFFDDYFGEDERPGIDARPGFSERMSSIEKSLKKGEERFSAIEYKLDKIDYELRPNSGMSLRDAVNRIEERINALESKEG